MVTTDILAFYPCTIPNYDDLTRYLRHLNTGLHTASDIKPSRIPGSKQYQADDIKGCLLATTVRFVPFKDLLFPRTY